MKRRDWLWVGGATLGMLVACQPERPSPTAPTVPAAAPTEPAGSTRNGANRATPDLLGCFVGRLIANQKMDHVNPGDYCADGQHYLGAPYRLSRLNLFGLDSLSDDWIGEYVVVAAVRRSGLANRLRSTGPCPDGEPFPIQARGDWAPAEGSYHTSTERLTRADYLEAHGAARRVSLASIRRPEQTAPRRKGGAPPEDPAAAVHVDLRNPLDGPLDPLRVVFHYEGGPGKPMPYYDTVAVPALTPGSKQTVSRPAAVEREVRDGVTSWWRFESIALEGRAGDCELLSDTYRR